MTRVEIVQILDREIAECEHDLARLKRARQAMVDTSVDTSVWPQPVTTILRPATILKPTPDGHKPTIAAGVAKILEHDVELSLNRLQEELLRRFRITVTQKNLANILNRWVRRSSKFKRPKPNTYRLL